MDCILNHTATSTEWIWKALKIHKEDAIKRNSAWPSRLYTCYFNFFFFFNLLQLEFRFLNEFEQLAQETF